MTRISDVFFTRDSVMVNNTRRWRVSDRFFYRLRFYDYKDITKASRRRLAALSHCPNVHVTIRVGIDEPNLWAYLAWVR